MISGSGHLARFGPSSRGIALMLVMLALAMVFTIVLSFISEQSVSIAIARNITSSAKARQICETGISLAIFEVQTNPDWRMDHAHGIWVDASQFGGGTFTITAEDGEDLNGDGVIDGTEGDGDLADDPLDRMTLTASGTYEGVSHRVQALVIPNEVIDPPKIIIDGYMRMKDAAVLDSFDSSMGPYGGGNVSDSATIATNSTASGDLDLSGSAVIEGDILVGPGADPNDVIALNGATITGTTGTLAEAIEIPTVSEPTGLPPSVGDVTYGSGTSILSSDLHATKMKIENGAVLNILGHVTILTDEDFNITHNSELQVLAGSSLKLYSKKHLNFYGTSKFNTLSADPGAVEIYNLGNTTVSIDDSAQVYATVFSPNAQMDVTGSSHFYGRFTGKSLDITGNSGVHLDLAGTAPPPPAGGPTETVVFSNDPIKISGDAYINSYDSTLGPYGGGNAHQNARVITNAAAAGDVDVDGGSIGGDVEVGVGGNPATVISNPANVTGDKSALTDPFPLPSITVPTDLGPSIGDVEFKDDPFLITTDMHVDDMRIANDAVVTFSGDIRVLVEGDFTLETRAGYVVAPDSTVELWVRGRFQTKTGGLSTDPRRVRINLVGDEMTKLETKSKVYGHILAPDRYVLVQTESQFHGAIQARQIELKTDAAIHQDEKNVWDPGEEAEGGGGPEIVAGGGGKPYRIRWIENP